MRDELEAYGHDLVAKREIIALNKIDALDKTAIEDKLGALEAATGGTVLALSGVAGTGVDQALLAMLDEIERWRGANTGNEAEAYLP